MIDIEIKRVVINQMINEYKYSSVNIKELADLAMDESIKIVYNNMIKDNQLSIAALEQELNNLGG